MPAPTLWSEFESKKLAQHPHDKHKDKHKNDDAHVPEINPRLRNIATDDSIHSYAPGNFGLCERNYVRVLPVTSPFDRIDKGLEMLGLSRFLLAPDDFRH